MKKIFLSIFLFLLFVSKMAIGQAGVYHPFPSDSATWCYGVFGIPNYAGGFCNGIGFCGAQNPMRLGNDTIINNLHYSILIESTSNLAYLRQDIANKKVYVLPAFVSATLNDSTEYLAYDGNWQIGDTVPGTSLNNSLGDTILISAIDSVQLNDSTYRKRVITNIGTSWIEGIGIQQGFFEQMYPFFEYGLDLLCFHTNNFCLFKRIMTFGPSNNFACGFCSDSLLLVPSFTSISDRSCSFKIFPNPNVGKFSVYSNLKGDSPLSVYSVLGECIHKQNLKVNDTCASTDIDLSFLPKGIYFVLLNHQGKLFSEKIIINE